MKKPSFTASAKSFETITLIICGLAAGTVKPVVRLTTYNKIWHVRKKLNHVCMFVQNHKPTFTVLSKFMERSDA